MLKALRGFAKEQMTNPPVNNFDRAGFAPVLDKTTIVSLDIGARGGAQGDLLPLARAVDLYGFEPDRTEFERLKNQKNKGPWKNFTPLAYALGEKAGTHTLYLYKKLGCSSLFKADQVKAALFSRADYYEPAGTAEVGVESLDALIARGELPAPDHIKIDVQGWELAIFKGAPKALDNVLALRTEVCFFDFYKGQPLFADIDSHLRSKGFVFMGFVESHGWRRLTKTKWPKQISGPVPYSKGQLIHADALYLKWPEDLTDDSKRLKLGLLAAAYGYFDHAAACLSGDSTRNFARKEFGIDSNTALSRLSALAGRRHRYMQFVPGTLRFP